MSAATETVCSFGQENFGSAQLGDARRSRRLVYTADRIVQHPGGTLPDKLADPADLTALYRLANASAVTHTAVLQPHRERTQQRAAAYPGTVLYLHDTTELDYTGKKSLRQLGQIGNGRYRGYLCHNSLAVGFETRECLGLANQILFRRPKVAKKESRAARRRRTTRESRLWKRGSEEVGPRPAGKRCVDVCDRGADLFEYLDHKHVRQESYVVRAAQDRKVVVVGAAGQEESCKLFAYTQGLPALGERTVPVPAREGQPAREAVLRAAAGPLRLLPPRHPRGEHRRVPLDVWVVHAREVNPPPGVEPLEWVLLTNVPVQDFADASERLDWYACRWLIEELHKGMKTGCAIEALGFHKEERLEPVIGLLSVVAVFLLQLRDLSRRPDAQERPARGVVPLLWVRLLSRWRCGQEQVDWSIHEFCYALARLGGHQNRKGDGQPGWQTLWRGWTKLQGMLEGVSVMEPERCGEN